MLAHRPGPNLGTRERGGRWSRRRILAFALTLIVVVAVAIGVAVQATRSSGPYYALTNRSFAAEAWPAVVASNRDAATLASVLDNGPSMTRSQLTGLVDDLASSTAATQKTVATITVPHTDAGTAGLMGEAVVLRAQAMATFRTAMLGLLAGGGETAVAAELAHVGALLARGDTDYARLRQALRRAAGHQGLPGSRWVRNAAQWQVAALDGYVGSIAASSSLAAVHDVAVATVWVTPSPLPGGSGASGSSGSSSAPSGTSLLPPTGTLQVFSVVANRGNVDETSVTVVATLQVQGGGSSPVVRRVSVSLKPGGSISIHFGTFRVRSGSTYVLTVVAGPVAGQAANGDNTVSDTFQIGI